QAVLPRRLDHLPGGRRAPVRRRRRRPRGPRGRAGRRGQRRRRPQLRLRGADLRAHRRLRPPRARVGPTGPAAARGCRVRAGRPGNGAVPMSLLVLGVSIAVVAATLVATYLAARRTSTTDEFWTAGGGLSGRTNGIAIAGDFLSSSSLLGYAGLAFLFGLDGVLYAAAASGIFLVVLFLIAEKMRNLGRFTFADALALRLRARPVRAVSAVSALCVCIFYLLAQLVGGGVLLEALTGISFNWAVVVAAVLMLCYVLFGGM